jgi:hypothetical protein
VPKSNPRMVLLVIVIFVYICVHNQKANHNKDYSVVKTFKIAPTCRGCFLLAALPF